jgi:hypothetical protein
VPIGAMLLLLLDWSRYRNLFARAAKVDVQWRDLGALARTHNLGSGLAYYLRSKNVAVVLAAKLLHDSALHSWRIPLRPDNRLVLGPSLKLRAPGRERIMSRRLSRSSISFST